MAAPDEDPRQAAREEDALHEQLEKIIDQIHDLEDNAVELLATHSPTSEKCLAKIKAFDENPEKTCGNHRQLLSVSMCKAWKGLEEGKYATISEAMRAERTETFGKCHVKKPSRTESESAK